MVIDFPFLPPSVNRMFYTDFAHRTRHKSAEYRKFIDDVKFFMPKTGVKEEVEIEINLYFDTKRKNDIDNRIKPILDTLVHYGVIEDDSMIVKLLVEKYYCKKMPATVVRVEQHHMDEVI